MGSIDRNRRWVGTLLLCLAFIQYTTQPLYSASAAGRSRPGTNGVENPAVPSIHQARTAKLAGRTEVPVVFEANQGQANSEFSFISHGSGHSMLIGPGRAVITMPVITMHAPEPSPMHLAASPSAEAELRSNEYRQTGREQGFGNPEHCTALRPDTSVAAKSTVASVEMKLLGGMAAPVVEGIDEEKGKANYF